MYCISRIHGFIWVILTEWRGYKFTFFVCFYSNFDMSVLEKQSRELGHDRSGVELHVHRRNVLQWFSQFTDFYLLRRDMKDSYGHHMSCFSKYCCIIIIVLYQYMAYIPMCFSMALEVIIKALNMCRSMTVSWKIGKLQVLDNALSIKRFPQLRGKQYSNENPTIFVCC